MHRGSLILEPYAELFAEYLAEVNVTLDSDLEALLRLREVQTAQIRIQPHSADHWTQRSTTHLQLSYPELACSDAYKALLWLEDQTSVDLVGLRSRAALNFCSSLFLMQCFEEGIKHIDNLCSKSTSNENQLTRRSVKQLERLQSFIQRAMRMPITTSARPGHEFGCIRAGKYPWMPDQLTARSSATRASMNTQLREISHRACLLRKSHVPENMVTSCYGIFASYDIAEEEEVFIEKPALVAASDSNIALCKFCFTAMNSHERTKAAQNGFFELRPTVSCLCSNYSQGSGACEQRFLKTFGRKDSHFRVDEIIRIADGLLNVSEHKTKSAARLRLLARALVKVVHETLLTASLHPLNTSLMSGLVGYASSPRVLDVSFAEDIQMPIDILRSLNVSIFADLDFDVDILFTIAGRIEMNSWEDEDDTKDGSTVFVSGVNTCYSLLNHACLPNIHWYRDQATGNIVLTALRDISAGEELFISYLTEEQLEEGVQERRAALQTWMGEGAHYCKRCFPSQVADSDMVEHADPSDSRKRKNADDKLELQATPQRRRNGGASRSNATTAEAFEALPSDYDSSDEYSS
jgi:hypothetical protein